VTPAPDLVRWLLGPLNRSGIRYMVTGGLAAIIYGEPRLTNDVDIVLHLAAGDAERLAAAFGGAEYYVPPIEVLREEGARPADGHFNILHLDTALRADVYCLGDDPLGTWAMSRRQVIELGGESVWVAPAEYVILLKLRYYLASGSDRHLRDIRAMRRLSGDLISQATLDAWIGRLGLQDAWRRVLDDSPPA
jgi:hypothetical protein